MNRHKLIKWGIIIFSTLVVVYPLWNITSQLSWSWSETIIANLFPLFGISAFTILWLHIVGPALRPWLDKYVDFQRFLDVTEPYVLVSMLMHPLLLLVIMNFDVKAILAGGPYIFFGIIGLTLLLTFDIGKAFKKRNFVERHWNKILLLSTIGFLLIFFHSIMLGSHLQEGPLRILWLFFGTTAISAAIWNYMVKRFLY